jgi:hypothetical protein
MRRFFPTEQMLTEQLNTGVQETKVLNIYRNYLFTTQENQHLFRRKESSHYFDRFICQRLYYDPEIA